MDYQTQRITVSEPQSSTQEGSYLFSLESIVMYFFISLLLHSSPV